MAPRSSLRKRIVIPLIFLLAVAALLLRAPSQFREHLPHADNDSPALEKLPLDSGSQQPSEHPQSQTQPQQSTASKSPTEQSHAVRPPVHRPTEKPIVPVFDDPDEMFLTYLPFGNVLSQRLQLENAIFLALQLNRTLIVPPIIFGKILRYKPFEELESALQELDPSRRPEALNCKGHTDGCPSAVYNSSFALFPWNELISLEYAKKIGVRIVHRPDVLPSSLLKMIAVEGAEHLETAGAGKEDVHIVKDMYDDQIQIPDDDVPIPKDTRRNLLPLPISKLRNRQERLLHFTSLSGLKRFSLHVPNNRKLLESIRNNMIITHSGILAVGDQIVTELGGIGSYIGIYVRVGSEAFKEMTQKTITAIVNKLLKEGPADDGDSRGFAQTNTQVECQSRSGSRRLPILYVATNVGQSTHAFDKLYKSFPCVYRLHDFGPFLERLELVASPIDGEYMDQHFMRLIDLIVTSKGSKFIIGSQKSSFSDYAFRLHQWWMESS